MNKLIEERKAKGKFLDEYYKKQKYESAFIRSYTLMTEIVAFIKTEENNSIKSKFNNDIIFCEKINKNKFKITDEALEILIKIEGNNEFLHFPEFHFILFNIALSPLDDNDKNNFRFKLHNLRILRNDSAFTHDSINNDLPSYEIDDIKNIISIWNFN